VQYRACRSCNNQYPLTDFPLAKAAKNIKYYRHLCGACHQKNKTLRRHRVREEYISWKRTLKCNQCGFADYRALQFHHHNPDKEFGISKMLSDGFKLERIQLEASKCTVLCSNCHSIEHSSFAP